MQMTFAQQKKYDKLVQDGCILVSRDVEGRLRLGQLALMAVGLGATQSSYARDIGIKPGTMQTYVETHLFFGNDRIPRGSWNDYRRATTLASRHPAEVEAIKTAAIEGGAASLMEEYRRLEPAHVRNERLVEEQAADANMQWQLERAVSMMEERAKNNKKRLSARERQKIQRMIRRLLTAVDALEVDVEVIRATKAA